MKEKIVERLQEAGVGADRLIDVHDGKKGSTDHTLLSPDDVSGNYGVYAEATDNLVIIDIDDYKNLDDSTGLSALGELPATLEESTPHGGTHRFYTVPPTDDGRFVAAVFNNEFGVLNPKTSYGEVRVANQYVVSARSQLDGCGKDDCESCATKKGGKYEIQADRQIAEVDIETIVDVLSRDPNLATDNDLDEDLQEESKTPDPDVDEDDVLEYALEESDDGKLQRLWRGDYSDYGDRSEAESALAYKLAFWLQGDKRAVRRAMDRANTKKWTVREDDSYRESVLEAIDKCNEYYDPSSKPETQSVPTYDEDEVERGEKLLSSECSAEDPAGELVHRNGHYGYWKEITNEEGDKKRIFDEVTNYTLETVEHLKTDDSELLKIIVHPAHPMGEEYEVDVHPTVFNEARAFKEKIVRGRTTRYEPGTRNQQALNDLRETVGSQMVPKRTGVEHIGLVGEDYDEWVSPKGTVTADGSDDPEHRYYAKGGASDSDGGALTRKWEIEADMVGDYDPADVARILELLPKTRRHDRGLPILGWFYAAPLRPLIHDWEGEFNLLQVVGSTGTGKTSTLKTYWEAFGMEPDPFSASDTPFTLMKHMASSRGVPVWIDEYKPADIRNDRLDTLHRRLREVTKGTAVSKGQANLGEVLFRIEAPVVVSGEQKFSQSVPAVRRRAIMTTLSQDPTEEGSSYTRAFSRLTGTAYEDETGVNYPEGYDLSEHARAYYQFILSQDAGELEDIWNQCRLDAGELLADRDLKLEPTEFKGAQTILFGVRIYHRFAETVDADMSVLPTDDAVSDAFEHFASNIGKDGKRRGYDDTFLELFAQAASKEYVEKGEDYRFVQSQKWGGEVLAFHMPSVYAGVKRYVRDFNLTDEYNFIGKNDYLSAFRDKAGEDSYILKTNHGVRFDGGETKCVVIDPARTHKKLGTDFELRAFDEDWSEEESEEGGDSDDNDPHPDPLAIGDIEPSKQSIASTIGEVEFREYDGRSSREGTPAWSITFSDQTGEAKLIAWEEEDIPDMRNSNGVFEPDALLVKSAEVNEYEGQTQLLVGSDTEILKAQIGAGETTAVIDSAGENPDAENGQNEAATDGGNQKEEESEDKDLEGEPLASVLVMYLQESDGDVDRDDLVKNLRDRGAADTQIDYWISKCLNQGDISEPEEGVFRR